jgi:two-component sensor histidine kinase
VKETTVSERTFSEEPLLLRELTHRVTNEFSAAISFVSLTAARSTSDEVKMTLAHVQECLENYARVHRALQEPAHGKLFDAPAYLEQLCRSISFSKLNCKGIELVFVEHPLQMRSEQCWRLGMIVSELITNAVRHGFGEAGGVIQVELESIGAFAQCRVADNGPAPGNVHPGRGLKIIQALVKGLHGRIDQHFGSHGTTSLIIFPLYP